VVAERLHVEQDIRRLPLAEWQRLECGHPALRPEVLGTLVASAAAEPQPHYLLLRDEAGVAAAAICTVVAPGRVQSADALLWYGMEPRDRPNDSTYMNLVFYHLADAAPTLGLDTLLYGNLALDAKRRRGCDIHANHLYYRPHNVGVRWLLRPYFWAHRQWYWRKLR
jgi:hypothetical protein